MKELLKNSIAALILVTVAGARPCSALWLDSSADSAWNTDIKVSGDAAGWKIDDSVEDSGLIFAFANDSKNIYLLLKPANTEGKSRLKNIASTDFTVWVDTGAGKEMLTGFKLAQSTGPAGGRPPAPPDSSSGGVSADSPQNGDLAPSQPPDSSASQGGDSGGQHGQSGHMRMASARPVKVELLGLIGDKDNTDGMLEVKIGTNTARGVLEARIPIAMLGGVLPKKLSFGFKAKAPVAENKGKGGPGGDSSSGGPFGMQGGGAGGTPPAGGPGGGPGGPPPGGGMGGGPGGSMGGGSGGPGQQSDSAAEISELDLWIRVTPAKEPVNK